MCSYGVSCSTVIVVLLLSIWLCFTLARQCGFMLEVFLYHFLFPVFVALMRHHASLVLLASMLLPATD